MTPQPSPTHRALAWALSHPPATVGRSGRPDTATALIDFLRARLDEDESVAAAALESDRHFEAIGMPIAEPGDAAIAEHLAHWNPVRMAAEVAAKRAIIEQHQPANPEDEDQHCLGCADMMPCPTLISLAQPYDQHPDFDPAWRTS